MPTVYSPPVSTYVPLATITLSSTDSEIVFSSIPATYRDLVLVINAGTTGEGVPRARVNSDTGSNYSRVEMYADSSGPFSGAVTQSYFDLGRTGTGFSGTRFMCVTQFMDYSAIDKHKTVLSRNNDDNTRAVAALAQRWANTNAINTISCYLSANSYSIGSTFSLYGIEA